MTLLHKTLACEAFRKRERHSSAWVELGRSCSDLSSYTKHSSVVWLKEHFCVTFPISVWGPFHTAGTHLHPAWASGTALTALRDVQLHLHQTYTALGAAEGPKPGTARDPSRGNALLCSAIVQNLLQTSKLQKSQWTFCADQVSATSTAWTAVIAPTAALGISLWKPPF